MTTTELRQYLDALDEGRLERDCSYEMGGTPIWAKVSNVEHLFNLIKACGFNGFRIAPNPKPVMEWYTNILVSDDDWHSVSGNHPTAIVAKNHGSHKRAAMIHITYNPNTQTVAAEVVNKE